MAMPVHPRPAWRRRALILGLAGALLECAGAQSADDEAPVVELIEIGAAQIELQFAPGFDAGLRTEAQGWVRRCADAVAGYFGRFPLPRVELLLVPVAGDGVDSGISFAEPSPLVRIRLGRTASHERFADDWILVHEMIHLAVPRVPREQNWLHEGIATYVEAVARGRAGMVSAAEVWHSWVRRMPQGLPQDGDVGLDHTPSWGRTYWGGALFCLLADVRMREHGNPARGLQQALQGVLAAGGDFRVRWPLKRILATADAAVAQTTLTDLYEQMKDRAVDIDLDALWRDLGVAATTLHDDAPLAAVRRAILP
jgi:hypothetical protein